MAFKASPTEDLDIAVSPTTAGQSSDLITEDPESSSHRALASVGLVKEGFDTTYDDVQEDKDWDSNSRPTWDDDSTTTEEEGSDENSVRARSDDQPFPFTEESAKAWAVPFEPDSAEPAPALDWGDWKPSPAPKAKDVLSWVSPLPHNSTILEANRIAVGEETFPFLSAFLSETRMVDLPFQKRHGLARFLLSCTEQACYLWMKKWHPLHLELLGIREADELELRWWLHLVKRLSSEFRYTHPPEACITEDYWCSISVERIRHIAVHRQGYNTNVIRDVVKLIATTKNVQLVRDIEKVIETLYALESKDPQYPVSESARVALDSALWFSFTEPTTPLELLSRLAYILEKVCFDYTTTQTSEAAIAERSDVREPHRAELHHYLCFDRYTGKFATEYEKACVWLRHITAHRLHGIYSELGWVKSYLSSAKEFAALLEDPEAIEKIGELDSALPGLEARCTEQSTAMYERSEAELRELAELARQRHKDWTTHIDLSRFDYEHVISGRYEKSWQMFEQAAEAKKVKEDGPV